MHHVYQKLHFIHAIRGFLEGFGIPVALYLIAGMIGFLPFELVYFLPFIGFSALTGFLVGYTGYCKSNERLDRTNKVRIQHASLIEKKQELENTQLSLKIKREVLFSNLSELKKEIELMEQKKATLRDEIKAIIAKINKNSHNVFIQQIIEKYSTQDNEFEQISDPPTHKLINPETKHYYEEEKQKNIFYTLGYLLRKVILPVAAVISMVFGFTVDAFEVAEDFTEAAWHTLLIVVGAVSLFFSALSAHHKSQQQNEYREALKEFKTLSEEVHAIESDNTTLTTETSGLTEKYVEQSKYVMQHQKLFPVEINALKSDLKIITQYHNNVTSKMSLHHNSTHDPSHTHLPDSRTSQNKPIARRASFG